jgi:peptidoglycan/LPS O-acetylase OafA/YrhL
MRLDIQGLRALAVTAVLLFHLWDKVFPLGYLGVDVFFVISGFLMCSILSRKSPISFSVVQDFYFRRIKRIVPLYLFVIVCVLVAGMFLLAPIEFPNLATDGIISSTFTSNIINIHLSGYFDLVGFTALGFGLKDCLA